MRFAAILLLVLLAVPNLGAQEYAVPPLPADTVRPAPPAATQAAPEAAHPPSEMPAHPLVAPAGERSATASQAVLDEAFWRSVLAGVIVAVVSTLILRLIL